MTAEAQFVALLEWMGWKSVQWQLDPFGDRCVFAIKPDESTPHLVPLTLDLMHAAEMKLPKRDDRDGVPDRREFAIQLAMVCDGEIAPISATKEQRLEAILKCLNLWK